MLRVVSARRGCCRKLCAAVQHCILFGLSAASVELVSNQKKRHALASEKCTVKFASYEGRKDKSS